MRCDCAERKLTAGHDISDGGLVTCLLEMAFAGSCGLCVDIATNDQASGDARGSEGQLLVTLSLTQSLGLRGRRGGGHEGRC